MESYQLNDVAMISGLTTRTIRNYLNQGILQGEKVDGAWRFTEEEVNHFLEEPTVKQAISAKCNALVHDFLADTYKKGNRICMILDFPVSQEEAASIADFFCKTVTEFGRDIEFRFVNERNLARVFLSGSEDQVMDIIGRYYGK